MNLVQKLKAKEVHENFVRWVIQDILRLVESFNYYAWSFVKRGGNKVVHELAHLQPISFGERVWSFDVPENIVSRASKDMYSYIDSTLI